MKKVLLSFTLIAHAEKASYYRNVVAKFTGNALFPTPIISLADLIAALDKFEADILAARDGGHLAVAVMHDSEIAIDKMFRSLAHYVDMIADGDETIIISAGFQTSKDTAARIKSPLTAKSIYYSYTPSFFALSLSLFSKYQQLQIKDNLNSK